MKKRKRRGNGKKGRRERKETRKRKGKRRRKETKEEEKKEGRERKSERKEVFPKYQGNEINQNYNSAVYK